MRNCTVVSQPLASGDVAVHGFTTSAGRWCALARGGTGPRGGVWANATGRRTGRCSITSTAQVTSVWLCSAGTAVRVDRERNGGVATRNVSGGDAHGPGHNPLTDGVPCPTGGSVSTDRHTANASGHHQGHAAIVTTCTACIMHRGAIERCGDAIVMVTSVSHPLARRAISTVKLPAQRPVTEPVPAHHWVQRSQEGVRTYGSGRRYRGSCHRTGSHETSVWLLFGTHRRWLCDLKVSVVSQPFALPTSRSMDLSTVRSRSLCLVRQVNGRPCIGSGAPCHHHPVSHRSHRCRHWS
jgi:hypothetical protein